MGIVKITKEITLDELMEMFEEAQINLPPHSNGTLRATMTVYPRVRNPKIIVNIFDDDAETIWWYDLKNRKMAHCGYGDGCFWTDEEDIDYPV